MGSSLFPDTETFDGWETSGPVDVRVIPERGPYIELKGQTLTSKTPIMLEPGVHRVSIQARASAPAQLTWRLGDTWGDTTRLEGTDWVEITRTIEVTQAQEAALVVTSDLPQGVDIDNVIVTRFEP